VQLEGLLLFSVTKKNLKKVITMTKENVGRSFGDFTVSLV
jgi:hypothetical protein